MKKRGVIAIQFHWIFIIIAGALILLFFANVILKQKDVSEVQISSTVITDLDTILTSALVSSGTVNIVDIPRFDIDFNCNDYSIGNVRKQIKDRVIFSPDLIKGGTMIGWSLDWNVPSRVSNFLYLTTPQVRYIIVGSGDFAEWINESLPEEINKELVPDLSSVNDQNDYRVKFIVFNDAGRTSVEQDVLDDFGRVKDEHVSLVQITPSALYERQIGHVTFFQNNGGTFVQDGVMEPYFTPEGLWAAIYSANREMYRCGMDRAFSKLKRIAEIHHNRSIALAKYYQKIGSLNCENIHNIAAGYYKSIVNDYKDFTHSNADGIRQSISDPQTLRDQNTYAQLYSCALIY